MEHEKLYIAVDLGAESGRVILGAVSPEKLCLHEVYRFPNGPIEEEGGLRWDFDRLFSEVKKGIAEAVKQSESQISGIGVDSWGVDYGLLDGNGQLIERPYHYRDKRTNGMMEKAFALMDKRSIYENSGLQFMQFNTVYQLLSAHLAGSAALARAKKLVFIADLVSYYLCGRAFAEYTLASTSQLMDMRRGRWSKEIFDKLGLPMDIMLKIVQPGTIVGRLKKQICQEFGFGPIDIIAVGSHDTASAVAAVPAAQERWAYLSSGTWSLLGVETSEAIINDKSFAFPFTNEGGVEKTIRFLKNIMGLWLLQECKRQWERENLSLSYAELTVMAEKAKPFVCYLNPDRDEFISPGNMPEKINKYLEQTGQKRLDDKGQMARLILESLAFKYRFVAEAIEEITSEAIEVLHIVGGGSQNEFLCQFAADATGKKIIAGPVEATAIGNILMQAIATGQIDSLAKGRELTRGSFEVKEYRPQKTAAWSKEYEKFKKH